VNSPPVCIDVQEEEPSYNFELLSDKAGLPITYS
jgi:hypothetical protein